MGTGTIKLTHKEGFGLSIFPILMSVFLLLTYVLATQQAFIWIGNELDTVALALAILIAIAAPILLMWRFGLPKKAITITAVLLVASCGVLSIFTFPILQQLSASFALLGTYGFFISFSRVSKSFWRKGLIMAGLAALALPFALVPGTGMGFYLRLLTADTAAQLLAMVGHASLGAHDVLIFDNGIAQVDLPCSGLKSLFTGTGFFFVASLIMRREVNLKWMIGYSVFAGLLILANTLRVTILIWVSEILQHRDIAETIHMPLGVMLFCIVCMCGVFILLKLAPFKPEDDAQALPPNKFGSRGGVVAGFFVAILFLTATGFLPKQDFQNRAQVTLPETIDVQTIELTPTETRFFGARGRTSAKKWLFKYEGLSGSMLVVRSGAANGLHAPEVCMLGNGMSVDQMQTREFNAGNYRYLTVDNGRRNAVYWMQSEKTMTDDFRKRLSQFIFGGQDDWIMVTILFDERLNLPELPENKPSLDNLMYALQSHYSAEISRK